MPNRAHSSIDKLGVQELVGHLFEVPGTTYEQIIEQVKQATGKSLTKASLSRYHTTWHLRQQGYNAMEQQLDRLQTMLQDNPSLDLKQGAMALFWKKLVHRMADVESTFDNADLLEVAQLLLKAKRLDQLEAAARSKGAVDRPGVYLDCLSEFTDYLTKHAPSSLTALQEHFDGFMEDVKNRYAPAV